MRTFTAGWLLAVVIGCSGIFEEPPAPAPVVEAPPAPPAPEPEPVPDATAVAGAEPEIQWPRMAWARREAGEIPVTGVTGVTVSADGRTVWVATDGHIRAVDAAEGGPGVEVAASGFDGTLYVIGHGADWTLERWTTAGSVVGERAVLYRSPEPLGDLAVGVAMWDYAERVYFRRGSGDNRQVLSVTRGGNRVYEVTSASGTTGELTDPALRTDDPATQRQAPVVLAAATAVPQTVDPGTGALFWTDGARVVHRRAYDTLNWGADQTLAFDADAVRFSPNGWLFAV